MGHHFTPNGQRQHQFFGDPADDTGAVSESGEGMTVEGEIEDIEVGASQELTLDLEPGAYVLICNIYDEAEQEAHYQEGMRSALTVE